MVNTTVIGTQLTQVVISALRAVSKMHAQSVHVPVTGLLQMRTAAAACLSGAIAAHHLHCHMGREQMCHWSRAKVCALPLSVMSHQTLTRCQPLNPCLVVM